MVPTYTSNTLAETARPLSEIYITIFEERASRKASKKPST
jgi:hypothetical protein